MVPSDDELDPLDLDTDTDDELLVEDDEADPAAAEAQIEAAQSQLLEAAKKVDVVVLPLACVNEGKGAPIGMGIQRLWAQELSQAGAQAASPVFTAMADQNGQKVPALMVYRDEWTDERAIEGIQRFPNAKRAIVTNFKVDDNTLELDLRLADIERGEEDKISLTTAESWNLSVKGDELPEKLFGLTQEIAAKCGHVLEAKTWQEGFGTTNPQALLSYLVGVGNLSALQGRCVPASSDQLLSPLMDSINRDPEMDNAMQALHQMVDILLGVQPDRGAIPLCVQALTIAAQKRQKDAAAWHHLAAVARRLGDVPTALQAFNQAFNIDPTAEAVTVHFVQTLRRAEDQENALKVAQFAIERGNEAPSVLALCGSLLIDADQHDTAEPYLRRAVDEGKVPSAFGDLANVLWDRSEDAGSAEEDRGEALKLLRAAVEQPRIARSTLDMLLDLHEEENLEEARELILKAVGAHSDNAAALSTAANLYLEGDSPDKARPHLQAILKLPRRSLDDDAFARRSLLTLDIEEFDERYEAAIEKVQSDDAAAQAEAAKFMREIIARDERFWQPHLMLALAVRGSEGDSAALTHLLTASKLRPNDAEIHNLIAAIYRKQGQAKSAVDHLRMVVSLEPRKVEPVVALAGCLRDANLFDEARSVCEAALKMMPDHPEFKAIVESLPPPKDQQN